MPEESTNRPELKIRNNQYQSSRLYLRYKDHRDLVFRDKYYNAIAFNQEDEEGNIDDSVKWHKYKPHLLLGYIYGLTSIDVKNKIVHYAWQGSKYVTVIALKDYVVCFNNANVSGDKFFYASRNGYDWYTILGVSIKEWVQFGDTNSLGYVQEDGNTINAYKITVQDNEETGDIEVVNDGLIASKTASNNISALWTFGRTRNGFWIGYGVSYAQYSFFAEVTDDGINDVYSLVNWNYIQNTDRYSAYGDGTSIKPSIEEVTVLGTNRFNILANVLKNGEYHKVIVDYQEGVSYYARPNCLGEVIHKNGIWWYYYQQCTTEWTGGGNHVLHYRLRMFKSEDALEWEEVILPDYMDVNIVETAYRYSSTTENPNNKVRLIFNRDASVPTEDGVVKVSYGGLFTKGGNRCQNGLNFCTSLVDDQWTDREQGICINASNGYYVVFKNMDFSESEDNFAFSVNTMVEYGEPVQQGDYCNP